MDPPLQYDADSDHSSEERELYMHVVPPFVCLRVDRPPRVAVSQGM